MTVLDLSNVARDRIWRVTPIVLVSQYQNTHALPIRALL
jgi:hypothetical protein